MQRVYVSFVGGGQPYPGYVSSGVQRRGPRIGRPYFTRRTANRILRDIFSGSVDEPWLRWWWDETTLIVESTDVNGNVDRQTVRPRPSNLYGLFTSRDWIEARPRLTSRRINETQLLRLLRTPTYDRRPLLHQLAGLPSETIRRAIAIAPVFERMLLIGVLERQLGDEATAVLREALQDEDPSIRGAAAHALAHRPDNGAAPSVLAAFEAETDASAAELMSVALAEMGHGGY